MIKKIYNYIYMTNKKEDKLKKFNDSHVKLYIFTVLMQMFAIFLVYKCNDGKLDFMDLIFATLCAPFYIPYKLGTSWNKCFN